MNTPHIVFLIFSFCAVSASAQYGSMEFTSNWFAGNWPRWRAVNGQVMNAEYSKQFEDLGIGRCTWVGTNGSAIVVHSRQEGIYETVRDPSSWIGSIGGSFGNSGSSSRRVKVGEKTITTWWGMTNYPGALVGATLRGGGMSQERRVLNGQEVSVYDYGTRPTQEEIDVLKARLELQTKQAAKAAKKR